MKRIALIAPLAAAILAVAACGQNANDNSGSSSDDGGSGAADATLTIAYSEGGRTLDPAEANDITSDTFVVAAYDQLVTYATEEVDGKTVAKTDEIVPMLAESWEVTEDNTKYTFTLRDDVTFHSGNKLTSADVTASFDYIRKSSSASFLYEMAGIKKVTAPDERTVEITLTGPNHLFLQILPMYSFSIFDSKTVEENGGADWLASNTAGSGPFTVEEWDPATQAVLARNDDYWGETPSLSEVRMRFITEPSNRVQLLTKGDVDAALEITPKDVPALEKAEGVQVDSRPSNKILYFGMNNKVEPFDDPRVRQAVSYAIPYQKLREDVMYGQAKEMRSAVASSTPGWSDEGFVYEHDLEKAKKLLKEAGLEDGFSFDFILGSGFQDWNDDAVLIKSELEKIGVTMNIENMARAQFLDAIATGEVAAYISRWTSFVNDPGYHLGLLLTGDGTSNYINYSNKKVDQLWDQAATEPDVEARNQLYGEAQKIINDEAPWAYLYEYNSVLGQREGVEGYVSYPDQIVRFANMTNE